MTSIVAVATEWLPSKGGLSAFNMELCLALARAGHDVHCVVPRYAERERREALKGGVTLHSAAEKGILDNAPFKIGVDPEVIMGHDRPTGPIAARWRQRFPSARFALLLHVHPGQIDGLKSEASIAARAKRVEDTRRLIGHADAAFAVGRQLTRLWNAEGPDLGVRPFIPGLPTTLPDHEGSPVGHPRVMLVGRAEDAELKGVDVAARAMRIVTARSFPTAEFVVRGVEEGSETELERRVRSNYPKLNRFYPRPFDASRETIAHDLRSVTLVLQPSLEDGFGLVTLESIAVGTPTLVSDRAGVAGLLRRVHPEAAKSMVVQAGNVDAWADAIERVLSDTTAAKTIATELRRAIEREHTWDSAAADLISKTLEAPRTPAAPRPLLIDHCWEVSAAVRQYPRRTDGHWIERDREQSAMEGWLAKELPEHESGALLLIGAPGTGKSALLSWLVHAARERSVPVLAIKADLLPGEVETPEQLRAHLGLSDSVESSLEELVSRYGTALLVIDQLDALCEMVDAHTGRLNALIALIRGATELAGVRVVASVRPFELVHEARLRRVADGAREVHLGGLTRVQMSGVLAPCSVPPLPEPDLGTPHALDLMVQLLQSTGEGARFAFPTSLGKLRERFWQAAIDDDHAREEAAMAIATTIDDSGMLWVSPTGDQSSAVSALATAGLLRWAPDGRRVGFRHQSFADFARVWALVRRDQLEQHIQSHDGDLKVRPLVRSALMILRGTDRPRYLALVERLLSNAALHLRLLTVDTLLQAPSPSSREVRLFRAAVEEPATRRRALGGLGRYQSWLTALESSLISWMSEYPDETEPMAASYLHHSPTAALRALETTWVGTPSGRSRAVRVLSHAQVLGPNADMVLTAVTPHLVRESRFEFGPIVSAVAAQSPIRAAEYLAKCLGEVHAALALGEEVSGDVRVFDELEALEAAPEDLLDLFEPIADEWSRESFSSSLYRWSFDLSETLERLLELLLEKAPEAFFGRASRQDQREALRRYARVIGRAKGSDEAKLAWLLTAPERLALDPQTSDVIESLSDLTVDGVRTLDRAIGEVALYTSFGEQEDAAARRRRLRENRRYRLHLRSLLPQHLREPARIRADEDEVAQLPGAVFEPHRGGRGGFVVSPMTREQLVAARDADILEALKRDRRPFEFDDNDHPIGGPDEIVSELRKLAERAPERLARLVEKMREEGQLARARRLIETLAKHHPDPAAIERLTLTLFDDSGGPLAVDDQCAWALSALTNRIPLTRSTIDALVARVECGDASEVDDEMDDMDVEHLLFSGQTMGVTTIPPGAHPWLMALARHQLADDRRDPDTWARALRAVLQTASPNAVAMLLHRLAHQWALLGGEHWLALVREATSGALTPQLAAAVTHVLALHRTELAPAEMLEWLSRLELAGHHTAAAELAVLLATDDTAHSAMASDLLSSWIQAGDCEDHARGVLSAVDGLLDANERRTALAVLGEEWIPLARPADLEIALGAVSDESAWRPDPAAVGLLRQLQRRVAEIGDDGLYRLGSLLERFLRDHPLLVLALADDLLTTVLAQERGMHTDAVISDCLAASVSLRLALPDESSRTHALFERALAAGAPAAFQALDRLDGRIPPPPVRRPHAPRRVRRRRRRPRRW